MKRTASRRHAVALTLIGSACAAFAQTAATGPTPPAASASAAARTVPAVPAAAAASAPAAARPVVPPAAPAAATPPANPAAAASRAAAPAAPAPAPATAPADAASQRVEITGGRQSDTEERRRATAAKIVIGREEIDKFGDATVGEVLRRLPGVTAPGAPGRGGPPRLRGLGSGYTQILIDGQRTPPGFSVESLTPEQVERIEILRAPTAETGARAIAGTINIITREGYRRRLNDLRLGFGYENGQFSPGVNWTHNDTAGDLTYNLSGSAFSSHRKNASSTDTRVTNAGSGLLLEDRTLNSSTQDKRFGSNLTARLQWRLNDSGDSIALMPSVFHTESHGDTAFDLTRRLGRAGSPVYDLGNTVNDGRFTVGRLGLMWRQRLGDVRLELNGNGGGFSSRSDSLRSEFARGNAVALNTFEDHSSTSERSANINLKTTLLLGGDPDKPGSEQSLVSGLEIEGVNRSETRTSLQNNQPLLTDFGDNLQASSLRLAAYAQDEWNINPNWSAYAGLRWEGITTRGDNGNSASTAGEQRPQNRSSVWTPLAHAVWKPDPKSRDQVRFSLTRSYRSPPLNALIARPTISRDYPSTGANTAFSPDSAGNPALKPELATGIDVAFERYLDSGGVLSANVFHRNISNLIRSVTAQETVSYSPQRRYVRRQQNIGDAVTQGVELEAKFRLDQLITGAPGIELRSNISFFNSRVNNVPGPDNRLDQQAKATANFGGDYRLRGTPLTLGGNVNWVPGYNTRLDENQSVVVSRKQVWDAYALWTFDPATALRLLGSNLVARRYDTTTSTDAFIQSSNSTERSSVRSGGPSYVNWQLRLELKL
jgi:iron complex outermembrane receptor protein